MQRDSLPQRADKKRILRPHQRYALNAAFVSREESLYDIENVLFYNVGPSVFRSSSQNVSAEKRLKRSREQDDLAPYVTLLQLRKSRADAVQRKSGRDRYFQVTGGDQPGEFSEDSGVFRFAAL